MTCGPVFSKLQTYIRKAGGKFLTPAIQLEPWIKLAVFFYFLAVFSVEYLLQGHSGAAG